MILDDLGSCSSIPAIKLRLSLPDPLESLIMRVPPLDDLPLYTSKADAGVTLLKAVRKKLISSPRVRQVNQLVEIARPFAQDMNFLKPSSTREFNQYVPFKVSFTLTVIVFIVSTALHLAFMSVYHEYNLADRIFPKSFTKHNVKPVLMVKDKLPEHVRVKLSHRYEVNDHKIDNSYAISSQPPRAVSLAGFSQHSQKSFPPTEDTYKNDSLFVVAPTVCHKDHSYEKVDQTYSETQS